MFKNINKKVETVYGCDHVQHSWLSNLPWKMQTVINQGLRAPDTHFCKNVKIVCRWMRSLVLQNADTNHTFMCRKERLPSVEDLEHELNYCSLHFATHFLYALEIISYKHPDQSVRSQASMFYRSIVEDIMHFKVETKEQMETRLADVDRPKKIHDCPKDERHDTYI